MALNFLRIAAVGILALAAGSTATAQARTLPQATTPATASRSLPYLTIDELRRRYADRDSRYATIGGMKIHYKDEGPRDAPALFMVHGSESSLRTWDRITLALKGRYRIIRYDIPGYGLSDGATDAAVAGLSPTDIPVELLSRLGVCKITFVGVSSGGTMGMYLAARKPELVERLILSNTPSDPVVTSGLVMPQSFIDATSRSMATGFRDQTFWDEFLTYFAGDPNRISAQTRKEYYDFYRRVPEKHLIALVAQIGDGKRATVEMAKVRQPTFLVWGGADHLLPEPAANAIARYLKNAQISRVLLPDVGHYPPLEVPDRLAQLIAAFVEAATPNLPIAAR